MFIVAHMMMFCCQISGNPKFNATIWQVEQARTFLLFAGFEQVQLVLNYKVYIH